MIYAPRIMAEMASERAHLGLNPGKPLPEDARDRVLERMCLLFIGEATKAKKKPKVSDLSDEDWLLSLESEPHLKGINIRKEVGACQFWCKQNKVLPTRRRIANWLNKAERVVDLKAAGATHASGLKLPAPQGPEGWHDWLRVELSTLSTDHPAHGQLTAAFNCRNFDMMPGSWKDKCRAQVQTRHTA